jgi:predicted DNA-binding transcriptional regulator AlpA
MASERNQSNQGIRKRYGSEIEVELLTGISRRTLQKDRLLNRKRFPYYKLCGKVMYDLDEVEATIKACSSEAAA